MATHEVSDERYIFQSKTRRNLFILLIVGVVLFAFGTWRAMSGGAEHGGGHEAAAATEMVASTEAAPAEAGAEHHGSAPWLKRVYTTLWMNNVFFAGLGLIGLFFVAVQYAAQAGWSAGLKRIPLAMASWIPIAGVLMLVIWFLVSSDLFHWTHHDLYAKGGEDYDALIDGKGVYFFWPMENGSFPAFYIARMVVFFGLWYMFFMWIRKEMLAEDIDGSTKHWENARGYSAWFLIIFGVTSSVAAWDWVMSIDTHWFSTMMGWYVFASWWVTGLAVITLIVSSLKEAGYLKVVNANHLHDLGKFVFAFSIFWTYIWFSQFMLIYYANIPEETVYFVQRRTVSPYSWIFFANLILNFVLPFLLLMMRDSKRHIGMLRVVCPIVVVGHWLDYYLMVTPGVMKYEGGIGLLEIGMGLVFLACFLLVTLSSLAKHPLVAKNDPMLQESLGHHI